MDISVRVDMLQALRMENISFKTGCKDYTN